MILGPGLSLLGDVLWDQTLVRKERRLFVKMAVVLTTSEDMISEAEKRKQEQLIIKQAQQKAEKKVRSEQEELKRKQDGELARIKQENDRLREEREKLLQ